MIKSHDSDSETRCELSAWGGLELCEPIRVAIRKHILSICSGN